MRAHEYTFNLSNNLRNKRRRKKKEKNNNNNKNTKCKMTKRQVRNRTFSVSVQFHPVHVDVFCLPAVLDVAERGYSSLSCVYSLSLSFTRRTRLTLVFRFFFHSPIFFCWWEGLMFYRHRRYSVHYRIFF